MSPKTVYLGFYPGILPAIPSSERANSNFSPVGASLKVSGYTPSLRPATYPHGHIFFDGQGQTKIKRYEKSIGWVMGAVVCAA